MKLKLEKEADWIDGRSVIRYFVWVDDRCVEVAYTEEEAMKKYENVKANYVALSKQIIKEETL
jgi:hypothetical protein